jgi:hypothetical protein
VCVGSYDPVLSTYQSLGGPDRTSSQMGLTDTPCLNGNSFLGAHPCEATRDLLHSHVPATGTSHRGCSGQPSQQGLSQGLIVESYPVDTTLTTHPRRTPRSPQVITILSAPSAIATHKQSSTKHHITDIMRSRSKQ